MKRLLIAAALAAPFMVQAADDYSGTSILGFCEGTVGEKNTCHGIIAGGFNMLLELEHQEYYKLPACIPDEATYEQLWRIVTKYMEDNPKYLNQEISWLTLAAIFEAYPCK